ncbi:MAG: ATP-binding cassette domain-containing protein [Methanomassiliicoccales archaeon]
MTSVIEVENLVKIFNGSVRAVDGISFSVEESEIFGFLGPNGAGKTTTISILTTLLKPTSGSARILGHDVLKEAYEVRKLIGLVPQELTVDDDLTGRENMLLQADLYGVPKKEAIERVEELLSLVKLKEAADRLVKTYSGGMRKRLELAEGLIHRPSILFLDEPTLGLDVQTRAVIWDYIKELKRNYNMTIFMTTHYLEEADALCDRIAIIDHGRIMALDSPETLKRSIGGDVIEISIDGDPEISNLIKEVDGVVEVKKDGEGYRIKAINGEKVIPLLLKSIVERGYSVGKVHLERPNLDQVFLEYTGKSLRDSEHSSPVGRFQRRAAALQARRRR